jgi:Na+-transporting NADH:ubiquinone oxidoreductase subunit C
MPRSAWYTLGFATIICLVCSVLVTSAAVSLGEKQQINQELDKRKNVLVAAGLLKDGEEVTPEEVDQRFQGFDTVVVDMTTGQELPDVDPTTVNERQMAKDPSQSLEAPANPAQVRRIANRAVVYKLKGEDGATSRLILPVEGKGLWSTLYGFVAVSADLEHIEGLTFYEQKETPGLGGEVENPAWKALWPGRKIFGDDGEVKIQVIKGQAGSVEEDPYHVDGLSGATITSRGVTHLLHFWLGDEGFGKYLDSIRESRRAA